MDDPPVLVMIGPTGVGKSAFCQILTGDDRFKLARTQTVHTILSAFLGPENAISHKTPRS